MNSKSSTEKQRMLGYSKASEMEEEAQVRKNLLTAHQIQIFQVTDPWHVGVGEKRVSFGINHVFFYQIILNVTSNIIMPIRNYQ